MPRYFDIDTIRPSSTIVPARILFQTIRRAYFRPIARSNKSPKYVILRLNKSPNSNSYPILTGGRNPEKQDGGRTVDGCVRRGRSTTAGLYGHGAHSPPCTATVGSPSCRGKRRSWGTPRQSPCTPRPAASHPPYSASRTETPPHHHPHALSIQNWNASTSSPSRAQDAPHLTLLTQHPELKRPHIITLTPLASRTETPPYHHPHVLKTRPISPSLLSIQNWNATTSSPSRAQDAPHLTLLTQHPEPKRPHIITLTCSRRAPSHPHALSIQNWNAPSFITPWWILYHNDIVSIEEWIVAVQTTRLPRVTRTNLHFWWQNKKN